MNDKYFEAFARTSSGRRASTMLAERANKPEKIFTMVLTQVNRAVPHLVHSAKYSTCMLCDPVLWTPLSFSERSVAGMCLAFMERKQIVELTRHQTRSGKGKRLYMAKKAPIIGTWGSTAKVSNPRNDSGASIVNLGDACQ